MKISIISPVYNSEKYLKRSIESVIEQTYTDWEYILIDDGSTDESWNIISNYCKLDRRIKAFKQDNTGPGAARNLGIEKCTGEYIVFLDSDDYIDCDYLKLLNMHAKNNDIVFIDVVQVDENQNIICEEKMSLYNTLSADDFIRSQMTGKILWGGVRKAVSTKLLRENGIRFSKIQIGEENLYSYLILKNCKTYDFITEKPVYMYVNHTGSQSKIIDENPYGAVLFTLKNYIIDSGEYTMYANTINAFNVMATIVSIDRISQMYTGIHRYIVAKKRIHEFKETIDKKYSIDLKNLDVKAKIFIPLLNLGICYPIIICSDIKRHLKGNS